LTYTDSSSFCGVGSSCVCSVWPGGEQLITQIAETTTTVLITGESGTGKEREAGDQFERQYVLRVLESVRWNVSRGARLLGVHRNTVLTKLAAWGIQRPTGTDGRSASL